MGFPTTPTSKLRSRNDIGSVSRYLRLRHGNTTTTNTNSTVSTASPLSSTPSVPNTLRLDDVMIWNLSEEAYDYNEYFDNQVMEVRFPGYPCPPLGLLVRLCISIENWLTSDSHHITVVHCMTGKGRTSLVLACTLAWLGIVNDALTPMEALQYISKKRKIEIDLLCSPSQIRYVQYFSMILEATKPKIPGSINRSNKYTDDNTIPHDDSSVSSSSSRNGHVLRHHRSMVLRRIIMNGIPDFTHSIDEVLEYTQYLQQQHQQQQNSDNGGASILGTLSTPLGNETISSILSPIPLNKAISRINQFGNLVDTVFTHPDDRILPNSTNNSSSESMVTSGTGITNEALSTQTESTESNLSTILASSTSMLGTVFAKIGEASDKADEVFDKAIDNAYNIVADKVQLAIDHTTQVINTASSNNDDNSFTATGEILHDLSMIPPSTTNPSDNYATSLSESASLSSVSTVNGIAPIYSTTRKNNEPGCCPFLQLYVGGKLVYSSHQSIETHSSSSVSTDNNSSSVGSTIPSNAIVLPWYTPSDTHIRFPIEVEVTGDILIRCRDYGFQPKSNLNPLALATSSSSFSSSLIPQPKETIFRTAFHIGYVSGYVLRLSKRQLDVANNDPRISSDFFVELVFGPADADTLQHMATTVTLGSPNLTLKDTNSHDVGHARFIHYSERDGKTASKDDHSATDYDGLLYNDTEASVSFWMDIEKRKLQRQEKINTRKEMEIISSEENTEENTFVTVSNVTVTNSSSSNSTNDTSMVNGPLLIPSSSSLLPSTETTENSPNSSTAPSSSGLFGFSNFLSNEITNFVNTNINSTTRNNISNLVTSSLNTAKTLGKEFVNEVNDGLKEATLLSRETASTMKTVAHTVATVPPPTMVTNNTNLSKINQAVQQENSKVDTKYVPVTESIIAVSSTTTTTIINGTGGTTNPSRTANVPTTVTSTNASSLPVHETMDADLAELEHLERELASVPSTSGTVPPSLPSKTAAVVPNVITTSSTVSTVSLATIPNISTTGTTATSAVLHTHNSDDISELEQYLSTLEG